MPPNFLDNSLSSCESSLEEIEQIVKSVPGNKKWQHELNKCHARIGYLHFAQSNFAAALNSYSSSLNITERLLKVEPNNNRWIHNLSIIHELIGNVHRDSENLSAALISYSSSIKFIEQVAFNEPGNSQLLITLFTHHKWDINITKLQDDIPATGLIYLQDLVIRKEIFGENHPVYVKGLRNLEKLLKNPVRLNRVYGDMKKTMFNDLPDREVKKVDLSATETYHSLEKFIFDELERTKNQN